MAMGASWPAFSSPTGTCASLQWTAARLCLRLLRERCLQPHDNSPARLRTLHASASAICPDPATDLVISHFFLDCLTEAELRALALRLANTLPAGARWLVSDFGLPAAPLLRPWARLYLKVLYTVFRGLTGLRVSRLPPISAALLDAGFVCIRHCEFAAGTLYTELWQLGEQRDGWNKIGATPAASASSTRRPQELQ